MAGKLELKWVMDVGRPGTDSDPNNPLRRVVSRLMRTGKPFSRLCLAFLTDESGTKHWFGAFAEQKRLMFFPGFSAAYDSLEMARDADTRASLKFAFDHFTLEQDKRLWHITATQSAAHLAERRTLELGQGRVLWFGLSFGSFDSFGLVYDETVVEFDVPATDADRRMQVLRASRENAEFPDLSMPELKLQDSDYFFHVSVIAGPSGFELYEGGEHAFPIHSPYLEKPMPNPLENMPTRVYRVELSAQSDIQITVMRVPGRLAVPLTITANDKPSVSGWIKPTAPSV